MSRATDAQAMGTAITIDSPQLIHLIWPKMRDTLSYVQETQSIYHTQLTLDMKKDTKYRMRLCKHVI